MGELFIPDACEIPVFYKVISETEKAIKIIADDIHAISKIPVWVPKSALELHFDDIYTKQMAEKMNNYRLKKWFEKKMDYRTAKGLNRVL